MKRLVVLLVLSNITILLWSIYQHVTLENRIAEIMKAREGTEMASIVEKINRNRKLVGLEELRPAPGTYAEVIKAMFDTSTAFLKKMGVDE